MERQVTDDRGTTWTCVQAYSGLSEDAAQVKGEDAYWVVCTPSGGAQSVRLKLQENWQTADSDDDLLRAIQAAQNL